MEGILRQELLRLKVTEKGYAKAVSKLPRGTLQEKRIKGIIYLYLVSSRDSKLRYRCVSGLPEGELKKLKEEVALRKKYQALLKETRQDIKRLTRILHVKKRSI